MSETILVTGGAGFIGFYLADASTSMVHGLPSMPIACMTGGHCDG